MSLDSEVDKNNFSSFAQSIDSYTLKVIMSYEDGFSSSSLDWLSVSANEIKHATDHGNIYIMKMVIYLLRLYSKYVAWIISIVFAPRQVQSCGPSGVHSMTIKRVCPVSVRLRLLVGHLIVFSFNPFDAKHSRLL